MNLHHLRPFCQLRDNQEREEKKGMHPISKIGWRIGRLFRGLCVSLASLRVSAAWASVLVERLKPYEVGKHLHD